MRSGAALFVLRDLDRPFSEVEGLSTVLMCTRCRAARREAPAELLAHHDPGEPWLKWGCPIQGCGHRVLGPWDLEGHAAAEHPGWIARYELLRPYPNQLQRITYRRSTAPTSEQSTPRHPPAPTHPTPTPTPEWGAQLPTPNPKPKRRGKKLLILGAIVGGLLAFGVLNPSDTTSTPSSTDAPAAKPGVSQGLGDCFRIGVRVSSRDS